jgi:restriction system-associated AAA family ATPase
MRLKRIELYDDFRSLKKGFTLDFIQNSDSYSQEQAIEPFCIVGKNGSGKSNVLELLSAIFYQVEVTCLDFLPKELVTKIDTVDEEEIEYEEEVELAVFQSNKTKPNAYKLEYYITHEEKEILVSILKEPNDYRKIYLNNDYLNPLDKKDLQNKEVPILPEYIIGYSSGQNEILSLPFFKMRLIQYDEYISHINYKTPFDAHESRMVYLDDAFSQAIFITNFIYDDVVVNKVFRETIELETIESFRIIINQNVNLEIDDKKTFIREQIGHKIELLKKCSTIYFTSNDDLNRLTLDFYLDDEVKKAFKVHFGEGKSGRLKLFQTLQTFINLNYYYIDKETKYKLYNSDSLFAKGYLPETPWNRRFFTFKNFMIKKKNITEPILSRSLSDGEYQFLHSIGLALIYRDTQSLFLLDEPETHFNPSWRAEYMSAIKHCFKNKIDEKFYSKSELIVTSHSPFIVSDTKEDNVLIFEKDENGKVDCKKADFNTFGASVNKITMKVFGKKETIGDVAKDKLAEYKKRLDADENIDTIIHDIDLELGESVEKILFMKMLFDKQEAK